MAVAPLILGLIGAGAGYLMFGTATFLGLSAAAWGFMVGSTLGNVLFPPKLPAIEGPRVTDFSIPQNDYGAPIAVSYGTVRVQCPIIWVGGIKEVKRVREAGGKGGGGGQKITTYDYYGTFACLIGEGPIDGISRIWADGRVIFDSRISELGKEYTYGETTERLLSAPPGSLARHIGEIMAQQGQNVEFRRISLFHGTEGQPPSDVIESYEGVGNVSANRGLAYLVIEDLHLKKFLNRIPNISVEVSSSGSYSSVSIPYTLSTVSESLFHCTGENRYIWHDRGFYKVICPADQTYEGSNIFSVKENVIDGSLSSVIDTKYIRVEALASTLSLDIRAFVYDHPSSFVYLYDTYNRSGYNSDEVAVVINGEVIGHIYVNSAAFSSSRSCAYDGSYLYFIAYSYYGGPTPKEVLAKAEIGGIVLPDNRYSPSVAADSFLVLDRIDSSKLYVVSGSVVELYDTSSLSKVNSWSLPEDASGGACVIGNIMYYASAGGANSSLYCVRLNDDGTVDALGSSSETGYYNLFPTKDYEALVLADHSTAAPGSSSRLSYFKPFYRKGAIALSDVVSDVLNRAGIDNTRQDLSAISTILVNGAVIKKPMQYRQVLESLMRVFFFDMAEEDGKLVAKLRSSVPYASIDLAKDGEASVYSTTPKETETVLGNELELPKKVSILYLDKDRDYNIGEQNATRESSYISSKGTQINDYPVVMSATEAARAADTFLYELWHNRINYSFSLPLRWIELSPGDTINIRLDSGITRTARIIKSTTDGGMVSIEALDHNPSIYSSYKGGWTNTFDSKGPGIVPYTALELMDIPLLRDADNNAGFYVAASPVYDSSAWQGVAIFRSIDGVSFHELTRNYTPAAIGRTTTVLPQGPTTVWDESSTVTIRLYNGTLTSATESQVLNGANALLIGNEIVQFVNAVQNADGTYTISKLLRGRRGTEWAVGAHSLGERVVKLVEDGSVIRINTGESDINRQYVYKGVTLGDTLENTPSKTFTNTGAGLKPLSPAHLRWKHLGSGKFDVSWVRRTRIGGEWRDYSDVPLGESEEKYQIEVWRTGSIVSSYQVSTPSALISAQDNDVIKVAQISSVVGPGFYSQSTILGAYVPPPSLGQYDQIIRADNPIAYWRLSDSGSIAAEEINNLNGSYSSGVSQQQTSIVFDINNSVKLNASSNDNIVVANNSILSLSSDMAVEVWVIISSTQSSLYPNIIWKPAGTASNGHANYLLYVDIGANGGKVGFRQTVGSTNYTVFSNAALNDDQIHHIVGVRRGSQIEIWVDGNLENTLSITSAPNTSVDDLVFGYMPANNDNQINAVLDEVAIYDYALERTQIFNHFYYGKQSYYRRALIDSPLVFYKMENVLGEDETDNNYDATSLTSITGSTSIVATTDSLGSNYFNNSSFELDPAQKDIIPGGGPFSVEVWINPDTLAGHITVVSQSYFDGTAYTNSWKMKCSVNNAKPSFLCVASNGTFSEVFANTVLTTGTWHHLVGVWDGSYLKIYVNGVLDNSTPFSGPLMPPDTPVVFGHHGYGSSAGEWYIGYMDEASIYNYALTDQQVADHYNARNNFAASYIDSVLRDKPEVCYRMEDLSILDSSPNRRDATIKQGLALDTTITATADSKASIIFNGSSSYIEMAASDIGMLDDNNFTLEAWVYPATTGINMVAISQSTYDFDSANLYPRFVAKISSINKFEFSFLTGTSSWVNILSTTTVSANTWYHFVCTWDASTSTMRLYLNGVEEANGTFSGSLASASTPIHIGARYRNNVLGDWFNGRIDEVAIYNRTLKPEEILEHYNARNK